MSSDSPAAVQIDSVLKPVTEGYYGVEFKKILTAATTYLLFIDKSNASSSYKHSASTSLRLGRFSAELIKDNISADWEVDIGVIMSIDITDAEIAWLESGSLQLKTAEDFETSKRGELFPIIAPLDIETADLKYIATNNKETDTGLTTASTVEDISGSSYNVEAGDVIIRAKRNSGAGNATVYYAAWYYGVS